MRSIAIRGARENNLRAIDLDLPLGALVVLTGVSGSGKSSLALDTLHAEGRRRYLEALSTSLRHAARGLSAPEVDLVTGLPPTIALEQRHAPPSSRSTVGTLGEILPVLRVLFARVGVQHCPGCGATIQPHTHDEIVTETKAEDSKECARTIHEVMTTPPEWIPDIPLGCKVKIMNAYEK